jgi:hypothetical protein
MPRIPEILQRLALHIGNSEESCQLLATAANPCQIALFTDQLKDQLQPYENVPELFSTFLSWCGNNRVSANLQTAIEQRSSAVSERNWLHRYLVECLWLNPNEQRLTEFLSSIKVLQVSGSYFMWRTLCNW